jgi:hypothetical protein
MVHGTAGADGTFRFEDVDFHDSFSYSVMATYLGTTYFSPPVNVQKGETSINLDAMVYDTTDDLSNIKVNQLHVFFYIEEGRLGVTQFYTLSNTGDQTVRDAITLPRDRTGTLKFNLPDEAQNVSFGNDSTGSRYVLLPGGFADTAPILPGNGASQVIVGYNLPYTGKLEYNYAAPADVEGVSFLVLEGSGLSLEGKGIAPPEESVLQDGSKFNVYKASSLNSGENIRLTLSGQPGAQAPMSAATIQKGGSKELGIGLGILGVALAGAGIWWWRRREDDEPEEMVKGTIEGILAEIHALDQAHERGELQEDEYQESRARLLDQLKLAVASPME